MTINLRIQKAGQVPTGCFFESAGVVVAPELAIAQGFVVLPEDAPIALVLFCEYCKHAAALLPRHADPKSIPETG